jgi:hypothetical protein
MSQDARIQRLEQATGARGPCPQCGGNPRPPIQWREELPDGTLLPIEPVHEVGPCPECGMSPQRRPGEIREIVIGGHRP